MSEVKTVDIGDFSVSFYGGPEGFQNKCRVIIALYDLTGKPIAFVKFYNEGVEIEADGFDDKNIFWLNFPDSAYSNVLDTLRSKRPLQLMFDGKIGMLLENKFTPFPGQGINLN